MPKHTSNVKDFTRPADQGDRFMGLHDNKKEGREPTARDMQNFVKAPKAGAATGALKGGAKRGTGAGTPKKGPEHSRTKGKVVGRKGTR